MNKGKNNLKNKNYNINNNLPNINLNNKKKINFRKKSGINKK